MSVRIQLSCGHRGCSAELYVASGGGLMTLLTKCGVLRVQGTVPAGWYVDGSGALCPAHSKKKFENPHIQRIQNEPWHVSDQRAAVRHVIDELDPPPTRPPERDLELARRLTDFL